MAATILRRSGNLDKPFHAILGLFCLMLMVQKNKATQFTVGGAGGWTVPSNATANSFNDWAEHNRFQIGDSLLFVYKPGDSVLQVTKEGYENCSTESPLAKFEDSHTVFSFSSSGPYYFISGNKDNCHKHEKLIVIVLADRSNGSSNTNQTAPASSPSPDTAPSPSPVGDQSPPSPGAHINPTPSPVSAPPNAASSMFMTSSVGFIGAIFVSSLTLAF